MNLFNHKKLRDKDKSSQLTTRIDVHHHFLPAFYRDALIEAGMSRPDGIASLPEWSEAKMIETMAELGTARAYLSISSPGVHFGNDAAARTLARRVNEEAARIVAKYPGKFGFFASTPLPDIDGALDEIIFAFDHLGASGVIFETNFRGLYLGNDCLEPLYTELNNRHAVLFLHPTTPGVQCGCAQRTDICLGYPAPMIEFLFDTTRSVTNMVLSGVFTRFPHIRVIVPHAGAALPILSTRIDLIGPMLAPPGQPKPPSMQTALDKFHFDLAGAPVPTLLTSLLSVANPQNIHYGSDWPYTPNAICAHLLNELTDDLTHRSYTGSTTKSENPSISRTSIPGAKLQSMFFHGNSRRLFGDTETANG